MLPSEPSDAAVPSANQMADLRLAASKLTGSARCLLLAEITLKYCGGSARRAERVFGWDRQAVTGGLGERRTGIECSGAQSAYGRCHRWEETYPEATEALRQIAEAHAQQDRTFRTPIVYRG